MINLIGTTTDFGLSKLKSENKL